MSLFKVKFSILGIIALIFNTQLSWSQAAPPKPTICTTPPTGYLIGGFIKVSSQITCIPFNQSTAMISLENAKDPTIGDVLLTNAVMYTGIDNNFNLNTAISISLVAEKTNQLLAAGYHWILMTGNKGTQKYLTCNLTEINSMAEPTVTAVNCGGNSVTFTIPAVPENLHNRYKLDWGDGITEVININATTTLPVVKTHTYTSTPPTIKIQGEYIRNGFAICKTSIKPIIPLADNSTLLTTLEGQNGGKEAKIQFVGFKKGENYELEAQIDNGLNTNSWAKLAIASDGLKQLTGLNENEKYCFRLKGINSCGNANYSQNTLCSINLQPNIKKTTEVELKWNMPTNPSSDPTTLRLTKEIVGQAGSANNPPLPSKTETSFIDNTINCTHKYLYSISTLYPPVSLNNTLYIISIKSAQITVDSKANAVSIKPTNLVSVGFNPTGDKTIELVIVETTTGNEYTFFRAINDSQNYKELGKSKNNTYFDVAIDKEPASYCYKYKYTDQCGITSALSDPFCSILLSSESKGNLNWTPYSIPPEIYNTASSVDYSIEYFDPIFNSFIPYKKTSNLEYGIQDVLNSSTQSEVKFRIMGMQTVDTEHYKNQFIFSHSNTFTIVIPPSIFIPTAFSPDGILPVDSETFKIRTKFISSGTIKIYDRWGATLFKAESLADEWNGNEANNLTPAPAGTYAYVINALSDTGRPFNVSGSILLLR